MYILIIFIENWYRFIQILKLLLEKSDELFLAAFEEFIYLLKIIFEYYLLRNPIKNNNIKEQVTS